MSDGGETKTQTPQSDEAPKKSEPDLVPETEPAAESSGGVDDAPQAVQIVSVGNESDAYAFTFHEERLNSVLQKVPPGWKVSVVSVVGAFRTGKSFLLSWFLRYLSYHSDSRGKVGADKGKDGEEKKWYDHFHTLGNDGFDWRGGAERNTTGIWIWSHPSFLRRSNPQTGEDENVAVVLVDTQGMFDHETTMALTASIFGLSTLLSSYQIYNVDKRIQEDNLQQLALFSEYGRMALQDGKPPELKGPAAKKRDSLSAQPKPFQRIDFLVRDWQNFEDDEDLDAMEAEMDEYLQKVIAERDAADLKETRDQISACFEKVSNYHFTHPGFAVTKKKYTGDVGVIEPTFLMLLDRYCQRVFNRDNLVPKAVHGREITAAELGTYIKNYALMFEGGARFPEASTMLSATATANNTNATNITIGKYKEDMDKIAGTKATSYLKPGELEQLHRQVVEECIEMFDSMANFGDQRKILMARENAVRKINTDFEMYSKLNEGRNPLHGMEIYIVSTTIAVLAFVLRWIADSTCSSWSQTCRAGSDLFSHIYAVVILFMVIVGSTKAKELRDSVKRMKAAFDAVVGGGSAKKKE
eukprot:CAMPEP_0183294626 /NCGR_PEP_ID=MMETSP0160_2-20130417/2889_1 /TAXON_ID=2839 ORGANISM="Odontella Sinensis, Strain Grunow 1884" /NCGR_SAMPLE_ID=MMETSP0160_2 /ASSEMBLY_ACC=CAM_ASM_000250 /LENGTH=583 /DNA_ID=CAMNT_0025455979 /DNA_START=63 /DNA_END=1814 /DNA_ORIENTATION=-